MGCVDDLRSYLINVPPIPISDGNLPKYAEIVNHSISHSLMEYSQCNPIVKEKTFITGSAQTEIDIYNDIDDRFMDIILFGEKWSIVNGIYIKDLQLWLQPIIDDITHNVSFLRIQGIYDYLYMLKEYFENKYQNIIYNGSKIKVNPNTEYYIMYHAYRTENDIKLNECKDFEDLVKINLILSVLDSFLFSDEQPIRSVSISGISVSFNVENKDTVRRILITQKNNIIAKLSNIYKYVERF